MPDFSEEVRAVASWRIMVDYPVPADIACHSCGAPGEPRGTLAENVVEWTCTKCGALNHIHVSPIDFRVGQRLLHAGLDLVNKGEFDIAAILLVSAVDASLNTGIRDLSAWRATEAGEMPPTAAQLEGKLRQKYPKRVKLFEKLSGATMQNEIKRLHRDQAIDAAELTHLLNLVPDFARLEAERNRLVHMGEEVDAPTVQLGAVTAHRAVELLKVMYHAAFKRPALP